MGQRKRAALYSRVSTDDQAERGTSLPDQSQRTAAYCAEQSWDVVGHFVDQGVSGASINRPALHKLLTAARAGEFDAVVVTDPDRLSRDLVDGLVIERELDRLGILVVYLVQTTMSTLERQLRGVIAEEERRKIRDRMSRGKSAVVRGGWWPGGPPPYGYRVIRIPGEPHSRLEANESESQVLLDMIEAFVDQRRSTADIARDLNAREVPTPGSGRRLSNPGDGHWTHWRVRDTLKTATGISGTWSYTTPTGTISLAIPAFITEARHEQLRARLAETSTGLGATTPRHTYLLGGRITAPCGAPMHGIGRPDRDARTYRCSHNIFDRGSDRCDCPRVRADTIESAVWDTTRSMLTEPDRLLTLAGIAYQSEPDTTEDLDALGRKITRIEAALGTTIADLLARGIDPGAIQRATQQLEADLHRLKTHRGRVRQWTAARADQATRADRLLRLAESAKSTLGQADESLRRTILDLLDVRVAVTGTILCDTCAGRGLLPADPSSHGKGLGRTGQICPTCHRFRRLPTLEISGAIPDTPHLDQQIGDQRNRDQPALPFSVQRFARP